MHMMYHHHVFDFVALPFVKICLWTVPQLSIMIIYNSTWSILIQQIRIILSGDNLTQKTQKKEPFTSLHKIKANLPHWAEFEILRNGALSLTPSIFSPCLYPGCIIVATVITNFPVLIRKNKCNFTALYLTFFVVIMIAVILIEYHLQKNNHNHIK